MEPQNLIKTDNPDGMIQVRLPSYTDNRVRYRYDRVCHHKDVLAGFSRKIHLYDDRYF
jgi:hypothetical protein